MVKPIGKWVKEAYLLFQGVASSRVLTDEVISQMQGLLMTAPKSARITRHEIGIPSSVLTISRANMFWRHVDKSGPCWLWMGATRNVGYGLVRWYVNTETGGRRQFAFSAHRLAWALTNGDIPYGYDICHTCDNPRCVNPEHLFLASHSDNLFDCASKGRNGNRKLSPEQVAEIRYLLRQDEVSQTQIARQYAVSIGTIWRIKHH